MTQIVFYDIGFSYLIIDEIAEEAVKYINGLSLTNDVELNFTNCLLSYELSNIFDAVINKLKIIQGSKSINILHTYHQSYEDHLVSYFIKNSSYSSMIKNIDDYKKYLKSEYDISINFTES